MSYLCSNLKEQVVLDIADRLAVGHGEGRVVDGGEVGCDDDSSNSLRLTRWSYSQQAIRSSKLQRVF